MKQLTIDVALIDENEYRAAIAIASKEKEAHFATFLKQVIILSTLRLSIVTTKDEFFFMGKENRRGSVHECFYHKFFAYANNSCLDANSLIAKLVFYFYDFSHT